MSFPTPYDGSSPLFRIGTKPLDPKDWLEPDGAMMRQLTEKSRLRADGISEIFAELPESRAAQDELLALLVAHLPERFPERWRREGGQMVIAPGGEAVSLATGEAPLLTASRLVQDDLLLLQRGPAGWALVAGSLCFPSSWVLREKMGQVLDAIHAPVPGFGPGTRQAEIMARMFDAMRPETPMIRWNFSLYGDERLYHPEVSGPGVRRFGTGERADPVFLRVERQTLRKLPDTGAIAFSIRISIDPIEQLERHAEGKRVAAALAEQLLALTQEQLDYKGLTLERERVMRRLGEISRLSVS